jgi:hypothetical protein
MSTIPNIALCMQTIALLIKEDFRTMEIFLVQSGQLEKEGYGTLPSNRFINQIFVLKSAYY